MIVQFDLFLHLVSVESCQRLSIIWTELICCLPHTKHNTQRIEVEEETDDAWMHVLLEKSKG